MKITNDILVRAVELGAVGPIEAPKTVEAAKEAMRQRLSATFRDALSLLLLHGGPNGSDIRAVCESINAAMNGVERL